MQVYGLGREGQASGTLDGTTTTLVKIFFVFDTLHHVLQIGTTQGAGLTATLLIEGSNDYVPTPGWLGAPEFAGNWSNISGDFLPALTLALAGTTAQYGVLSPNPWRAIRATLTRTAGNGSGRFAMQGKGS